MGQKANPIACRLGIIFGWKSIWHGFHKDRIQEDYKIRKYINARLSKAYVADIFIERTLKYFTVAIFAQRPALIIGKGGKEVANLKEELKKLTGKDCEINILEVKKPELKAVLVAKNIASQVENRVSYKKAIKLAISNAMRMNAEGIKIKISGRLNGAEMARTEIYKEGRVPVSTFRADIDYSLFTAHTTYGCIGITVWIMKGEIYEKRDFSSLEILTQKKSRKVKSSFSREKKIK